MGVISSEPAVEAAAAVAKNTKIIHIKAIKEIPNLAVRIPTQCILQNMVRHK